MPTGPQKTNKLFKESLGYPNIKANSEFFDETTPFKNYVFGDDILVNEISNNFIDSKINNIIEVKQYPDLDKLKDGEYGTGNFLVYKDTNETNKVLRFEKLKLSRMDNSTDSNHNHGAWTYKDSEDKFNTSVLSYALPYNYKGFYTFELYYKTATDTYKKIPTNAENDWLFDIKSGVIKFFDVAPDSYKGKLNLYLDFYKYVGDIGLSKFSVSSGGSSGGPITGGGVSSSTLDVTDETTLNSTLTVEGAAILNSTLNVKKETTLKSTLFVSNIQPNKENTSINIHGDVKISGSLTSNVEGDNLFNFSPSTFRDLTVKKLTDIENQKGITELENKIKEKSTTTHYITIEQDVYLEKGKTIKNVMPAQSVGDVVEYSQLKSLVDVVKKVEGKLTGKTPFNTKDTTIISNSSFEVKKNLKVNSSLNVEGDLKVNSSVDIEGPLKVNSKSTFTGDIVASTITVDKLILKNPNDIGFAEGFNSLTVDGLTKIKSTLTVERDTKLNSSLNVKGSTTLKGVSLVLSDLYVAGNTKLDSNLNVNKGLTVEGETHLKSTTYIYGDLQMSTGDITAKTLYADKLYLGGSEYTPQSSGTTIENITNKIINISSTLNVTGDTHLNNTTISSSLNVNSLLIVEGDTKLKSSLNVKGSTTLKGVSLVLSDLYVAGNTKLDSNLNVNKGLTVEGETHLKSTTYIYGDLQMSTSDVRAKTLYADKLYLGGNEYTPQSSGTTIENITNKITNISSTLNVTGDTHLNNTIINSSLNVGSLLNVGGALIVEGDTSIKKNLIVDNVISAKNIDISENVTILGKLDVSGLDVSNNAKILGRLDVSGLDVSNNANILGKLDVSGLDVSNNAKILGKIDVSGLDVSNNANILGKLDVSGLDVSNNAKILGKIDVSGLDVSNNAKILGKLDVSGLDVSNNTKILGHLDVSGLDVSNNANILGKLDVSGLDVSNNANILGKLDVSGLDVSNNANILGKLDVSGLDVSNNAKILGNLDVSGLDVSNNIIINNDAKILGNLDVSGLDVSNNANILGKLDVSGLDISNNAKILGHLDVSGLDISNNAKILGKIDISGLDVSNNAKILGKLDVSGLDISNNAKILGNLDVSGLDVTNNANILGKLDVTNNAKILGNTEIHGWLSVGKTGNSEGIYTKEIHGWHLARNEGAALWLRSRGTKEVPDFPGSSSTHDNFGPSIKLLEDEANRKITIDANEESNGDTPDGEVDIKAYKGVTITVGTGDKGVKISGDLQVDGKLSANENTLGTTSGTSVLSSSDNVNVPTFTYIQPNFTSLNSGQRYAEIKKVMSTEDVGDKDVTIIDKNIILNKGCGIYNLPIAKAPSEPVTYGQWVAGIKQPKLIRIEDNIDVTSIKVRNSLNFNGEQVLPPKSEEKVLHSIETLTGTQDSGWYTATETNKKIDLLIKGYNELIKTLKERKIIKDS